MSVMPLRRIQHTLASMSTEDLRKAILVTVHADSNWPQGKIVPQQHTSHDQMEVSQISLLPGGEWLLILLHDGTINICQPLDLNAPPILTFKTPRMFDDACYLDNDLCVATSPTITPLGAVARILVSERYEYDGIERYSS